MAIHGTSASCRRARIPGAPRPTHEAYTCTTTPPEGPPPHVPRTHDPRTPPSAGHGTARLPRRTSGRGLAPRTCA
eukprot:5313420-Prorocentrum_lima.AAC.1